MTLEANDLEENAELVIELASSMLPSHGIILTIVKTNELMVDDPGGDNTVTVSNLQTPDKLVRILRSSADNIEKDLTIKGQMA